MEQVQQLAGIDAMVIVWNLEERMRKMTSDHVTFGGHAQYGPMVRDYQASLKAACDREWDKYLTRMRLSAEEDPEFKALLDANEEG